jgi:NADPH-dependent curcumin reductase CurA
LKISSYEISGDIPDFPEAFKQLYEGKNLGKMLLKLPAAM